MSAFAGDGLAQLLATDAPVLPSTMALQVGLQLGWSVVLAWLGLLAVARWWPGKPGASARRPWVVAGLLALWTWLPGPLSPAYWLGLAFQMPSTVTVFLCAGWLWERLAPRPTSSPPHNAAVVGVTVDGATLPLAALGVLLGWALLLDSFAVLPVQLYAWGFSPAALGLALLVTLLPWALGGGLAPARDFRCWVAPAALLVLVVWRPPTGNVWDALLDPWLWLALHAVVIRRVIR
jgi:hypothetical protein